MNQIWHADLSISTSQAVSLIERQFPHLAPCHIERLDEGWDNVVFLVNLSIIFRFPRRKVALPFFQTELEILPRLQKYFSTKIPNPTLVGQPTDDFPYPFAGYTKLPGVAAQRASLTETMRVNTAVDLARFLRKLHKIDTVSLAGLKIPLDTLGKLDVHKKLETLHENIEQAWSHGLISSKESSQKLIRSLRDVDFAPTTQILVHGDLNFRNFLVDDIGHVAGVIDWGDVHLGDPAVDLAIVKSFLPPSVEDAFWAVYGRVDETTHRLAHFRALYVTLTIMLYAHNIGDSMQLAEASRAFKWLTER